MDEITIRAFETKDRPGVVALAQSLQAAESLIHDRMKPPAEIGDWYVDFLLEACKREKGTILVAEQGDELVGYAVIQTEVSTAEEVDEIDYTYAYVQDIAVAESHRRRGIGAALLERCETLAREAGARWLRIAVLSRNEPAVRAYEKVGFTSFSTTLEKVLS